MGMVHVRISDLGGSRVLDKKRQIIETGPIPPTPQGSSGLKGTGVRRVGRGKPHTTDRHLTHRRKINSNLTSDG